MRITNPTTEISVEVSETPIDEIPVKVASAKLVQKEWAKLSASDRAAILAPLTSAFKTNEERIAHETTLDMGKPITLSRRDVLRAQEAITKLCAIGPDWIKDEVTAEGTRRYDPLGVIGVISPWNYAVTLPIFGIIPALIAGNSVVWKPSENAYRVSQLIAELIWALPKFPKDVLQLIVGGTTQGKELVKQPVQLISFTGSTKVGKEIMAACAEHLTRVQLELGGLDAAIVLEDADVAEAAKSIFTMNTTNSGQICCAVKRVLVHRSVYKEFLDNCIELSKNITLGDPFNEKTLMGPLANENQLRRVETFIADINEKGGKIHTGGSRIDSPGYFFPSTIVSDLPSNSQLLHEESFGPILPIIPFDSNNEAITQANNTQYGLTASIWTKNTTEAKELSSKLDVGVVNINKHGTPPTGGPWGGTKGSGIGRMRCREGMLEFCNLKYIVNPS